MTTENNYSKYYQLYFSFKHLSFLSAIIGSIIASFTFTPYLLKVATNAAMVYFMHYNQVKSPDLSHPLVICSICSLIVFLVFSSLKRHYSKLMDEIENGKDDDYRTIMRKRRIETYKKLREENSDFENLNEAEKYKIVKQQAGSVIYEILKCGFKSMKKDLRNIWIS